MIILIIVSCTLEVWRLPLQQVKRS